MAWTNRKARAAHGPDYAAKYPALAKRHARALPARRDFSLVRLGHDAKGLPVWLEDRARLEHVWCIGSTGSGKTTLAKDIILQDFRRGRGGLLIDPHGDLYRAVLAELHAGGFLKSGRVHLLDPNVRTHILPFNPLAPLPDTDISVIGDALLQAFGRAWGDEDTHQKPAIRSNLKTAFMALAELRLPLTDAKFLFDPEDTHGVRSRAILQLKNEYARDGLIRLHQIALADRSKREFNMESRGPINRINEFVSSDAVRAMLGVVDEPGKPRRTFDLLECMDRGDILLFNGEHGGAVSEADTDLLAAILLRYVFLLAARRRNREPWFVHVDECHRVLTGDVPSLLAESRKYGIAVHLYHQFAAQLGKRDDLLFQACLNSTEVKIVFRVKSAEEAQYLAENVIPLDLELPVQALVKPTVIGQGIVKLKSTSESTHEADSVTDARSDAIAETEGYAFSTSQSVSDNSVHGTFSGEGTGQVFGPDQGWLSLPQLLAQSANISSGLSEMQGNASMRGASETESRSTTRTSGTSRAIGKAHGKSRAQGESETFRNLYADLPTAVHSKENLLYMAGELIRSLPVGRAIVAWRGKSVCINVPPPKKRS